MFHTFGFKCVYDFKISYFANCEEVPLTISHGYMKFKSEIYGVNKKIKNAQSNGCKFTQMVKLTIKMDSSQSNVNICNCLKLSIPKLHREFFKILSQNSKNDLNNPKTRCNDLNNPSHFACRKWIISQYFEKNVISAKTDHSLKDDMVIVSVFVLENITSE